MKKTLILLLLLCFCHKLYPQSSATGYPSYYFDGLTVKDGLSQSSVLSIYQDSYGFMWMGTRDGLNKYDGYSFEVFRHNADNPETISGNIISDIKEDAKGNLWIATQNGLSIYDRDNGTFKNYYIKSGEKSAIRKIFIDDKKRIWLGGNFGLLQFEPVNKSFVKPLAIKNNGGKGFSFNVNDIKQNKSGNLILAANDFALYCFNADKNTFTQQKIFINKKITSRIESLFLLPNGSMWLGTYGDGLFLINGSKQVISHYHENANSTFKISNNNIRAIVLDNLNNLWVGTFEGLNIISTNGVATEPAKNNGKVKSLSHSSIRSLCKDAKGSVWIGTYLGGINYFDKDNQRFKHISNDSNVYGELKSNVIGSFTQDKQGNLYVGTERGGLSIYNKDLGVTTIAKGSTIKDLFTDSNNSIWAGVFKKGLNSYNSVSKNFIQYPVGQPDYSFLSEAIINTIIEQDGYLWIGTDGLGGVYKFNCATKKYEDFAFSKELHKVLDYTIVKSIAVLNKHEIAIATKGKGIIVFNRLTGAVKSLTTFKTDNGHTRNADEFNSVFIDKSNVVWLASNGSGIFCGDLKKNIFKHYSTHNGLSNDIAFGFLKDNNNNVWAVTINGVSKISLKNKNVSKNYTSNSGFPVLEVNEGAFFSAYNLFYIGGNNGYSIFNPDNLKNNTYIPKLAFTSVSVLNKKVSPLTNPDVLSNGINKTKKITLTYFQSVLTLDFAALSFLKPQNNIYMYKLEGFDENWISAGKRHTVTYTNLKTGNYTFLVKGANNDGNWNTLPLKMQIEVLPPPWKTWWAYIPYTAIILGGFYIIRSNGIKSAQLKHSLKTEQFEKEKWKEIHDLKLKYFIDVSHEFRTPLTLIISPLEELLTDAGRKTDIKPMIKTMYFNAKRLLLLIDQILEIREIETGHTRINHEPLYISGISEQIIQSFEVLATKKNIKLEFIKQNLPEIPVLADRDKLEKIFFNLLSNAFKFTPIGGTITFAVAAKQDGQSIDYNFEIKDTGIGIEKESLPKIFDRFYKNSNYLNGAGIGLSLTKSLVVLMGGNINVTSIAGKGTTFIVQISFNKTFTYNDLLQGSFTKPIPLEYQEIKDKPKNKTNSETEKPAILIVQDNTDLRSYLENQLSQDYDIHTVKNGVQGIAKAKKIGPDLIISDIMMPEMDGYELCRQIKTTKELSHIPVILLTAKSSYNDKLEGLDFGADDYISKPFNLSELRARIRNILENRRLMQERFRNDNIIVNTKDKLLNSYDDKLVATIINVIMTNISNPELSVEFLGQEVALSRVHLFRKLKSITGLSPTDFIKELRMKKAEELLKTGKYKTAEVAFAVGYEDAKYFSKSFKKHTEKTPSEYVKEFM